MLTVLNLDIAVTAIVQCIPAAKDVNAFLAALPADARTPALAALQELLADPVAVVRPDPFGRRRVERTKNFTELLWPVLQLNELTFAGAALAVEAMPAFAAATYLHDSFYDATRPSMDGLLRRCTRLTSVNVGSTVSVLDAVTTPAHRVSSLTLAMEVVMELSVLSSLDVSFEFSGLVALLVGVAPAFTRLTSLRVSYYHESDAPALVQFLTRLHGAPLRSLGVARGYDASREDAEDHDLTDVLNLLPTFPALEELTLDGCRFLSRVMAFGATLPSTLRRVTFDEIEFSDPAWEAFVEWLLRDCVLDAIAWEYATVPVSQIISMAPALREWITRGIQTISFHNCELDDDHVDVLAAAISHTTSPVGVYIRIDYEYNHGLLGHAAASSRGVSIEMPMKRRRCYTLRKLATIDNLAFEHKVVDRQPHIVLTGVAPIA